MCSMPCAFSHTAVKQGLVDGGEVGLPGCSGDVFTSDIHIKKVTMIPRISDFRKLLAAQKFHVSSERSDQWSL